LLYPPDAVIQAASVSGLVSNTCRHKFTGFMEEMDTIKAGLVTVLQGVVNSELSKPLNGFGSF